MSIDITENEEKVLKIVQEYLNKNRKFEINKIVPFIIARFRLSSININKKGIRKILKSLIEKNLLVEGSKLTRNIILNNPKRQKIYEFIVRNPGVYFNKILTELNLTNHTVVWHLEMLEKFDFIQKTEFENHEIYSPKNMDIKNANKHYFLIKDESRKIIELLRLKQNGLTKTQLSKQLDMHYYTVSKYISKLEKFHMIQKQNKKNKTLYFFIEPNS
jgi:predicted transcriptional regulator